MPDPRQYFGTDGVRAVANTSFMTPEFVLRLGQAAASLLVPLAKGPTGTRPVCLIGRDTRQSADMLEAALAAGLNSAGVDVRLCGVVPTPAVAFLVTQEKAAFGAVVSASHNPFYDNGVKFIGADGYKLTDEQELAIEAAHQDKEFPSTRPRDAGIGRTQPYPEAAERYIAHAIASMKGQRLDGLHIALDNANGASSTTSTEALRRLGARVEAFHSSPDGININSACGCTHPAIIAALVKQTGASIGISHDGDADRVLLCDENASPLSGDEVIAIATTDMLRRGTLRDKTLAATVMSNYGLDELIHGLGGKVQRTPVGDRYLMAIMRQHDLNFGAEESGHIIFRDYATTGDGLVAALQVLKIVAETGEPLSKLRQILKPYPQTKRYFAVRAKPPLEELVVAQKLIAGTETKLAGLGRVLLRYSGTEPLIRLLIEGRDAAYIEDQADQIATAIKAQIGV